MEGIELLGGVLASQRQQDSYSTWMHLPELRQVVNHVVYYQPQVFLFVVQRDFLKGEFWEFRHFLFWIFI
jgi:hypothetical protein